MTPEIFARVDSWLFNNAHERGKTIYALSCEWNHLAAPFLQPLEKDFKDAVSSAMTGILLALVKEVWKKHAWTFSEKYTGASFDVLDGPSIIEEGPSAAPLVLVMALEAAPREDLTQGAG